MLLIYCFDLVWYKSCLERTRKSKTKTNSFVWGHRGNIYIQYFLCRCSRRLLLHSKRLLNHYSKQTFQHKSSSEKGVRKSLCDLSSSSAQLNSLKGVTVCSWSHWLQWEVLEATHNLNENKGQNKKIIHPLKEQNSPCKDLNMSYSI